MEENRAINFQKINFQFLEKVEKLTNLHSILIKFLISRHFA